MINILLLEGQNGQAPSTARSLHDLEVKVFAITEGRINAGYASRYIDKKIVCPHYEEYGAEYKALLFDFLKRQEIHAIIPLGDKSARFLSLNKPEIESEFHTTCIVQDFPLFDLAQNKQKLMALCEQYDLPHPRTRKIENSEASIRQAVDYVGFPAMLKPDVGMGARGIVLVHNEEEIRQKISVTLDVCKTCTLQQFIKNNGIYYNVMLYRDFEGKILNHTIMQIMRYFPIKGGTSSYCKTIDDAYLVEICSKVLEHLNWVGFADFDIMQEEGSNALKILEINPRIPASVHSACVSGVNFPKMMVEGALNLPIKTYQYRPGKEIRFFGLDVMWFLFSPERFRFKPSWFKFWGKNVYYQDGSLKDPFPMLMGCLEGVVKYMNPSFRKAKLKK